MHSLLSPLLILALAPAAAGWPVGSLHEANVPVSHLPAPERAIAIHLLRPELGPLFQGEPSKLLDRQIQTFRAERIRLGSIPAIAIQATGSELCGATGNCSFWIIDIQHRRVLLKTIAQRYTFDRTRSSEKPDIVTAMHGSATEADLTRWQYEDAHYIAAACATADSAVAADHASNQPTFTPHPCNPEGTDTSR